MLLYQGSPYVKGKVFIKEEGDSSIKLKYIKPTKTGYEFITESEERVILNKEQLKELKEFKYEKRKI